MTLRLLEDVEIPEPVTAAKTASRMLQGPRIRPSTVGAFSPQLRRRDSEVLASAGELATPDPAPGPTKSIRVDFSDRPSLQGLTVLILKGGNGYLASDYWLEGTRLHLLTPDREDKLLPLERLDFEETVYLNQERNVEFVLRSQERSQ